MAYPLSLGAIRRSVGGAQGAALERPNVCHITLGLRERAGFPTPETCLKVYVQKKLADLPEEVRIPPEFDILNTKNRKIGTLTTDIVEIGGLPQSFALRSGSVLRSRDHNNGVNGFCVERDGTRYFITNAHVAMNAKTGYRSQGIRYWDLSRQDWHEAGDLSYVTDLHRKQVTEEDLAVYNVASGISAEPYAIAGYDHKIRHFRDALNYRNEVFWFNYNGLFYKCMAPEPVLRRTTLWVDGRFLDYRSFIQLKVVAPATARPGQSGAVVCFGSDNDISAVAQVFGGVAPHYVWAFPINRIRRKMRSL
ncbi:MAG: hypothetical protein AAF865_14970 [Pseudomonadota bacterium]